MPELGLPFRKLRVIATIGIFTLTSFSANSGTGYRAAASDTPVSLFYGLDIDDLRYSAQFEYVQLGLVSPHLPQVSYRQSHHAWTPRLGGPMHSRHAKSLRLQLPYGLMFEAGRRYGETSKQDNDFVGLSFSTRHIGAYEAAQSQRYKREADGRSDASRSVNWLRTAGTIAMIALLAGSSGGDGDSAGGAQAPSSGSRSDTPRTPPQGVSSGNWSLVWSDEFNAATLDRTKWNTDDSYGRAPCFGGGNNEQQCYVDDPQNISIVDGKLLLTARPMSGLDQGRSYTSGRIQSRGKGDFTYGKFEARIKLPSGQGSWPAFWMLPSERRYGTWAASGEIDVVEAVNLGGAGGRDVHGTLHFGGSWPNNVSTGGKTQLGDIDGFNTYTLEWFETEMRWYVNGTQYARKDYTQWRSSAAPNDPNAPFDEDFHLIFNLAIGGNWPGASDGLNFPRQMEIDWVRVYECDEGGNACLPN